MKPDPRAFGHAIRALRARPEAIHFFDDLPANVQAAQNLGRRAFQVRGLIETVAALKNCGVASMLTANPLHRANRHSGHCPRVSAAQSER
jgi:FMN phosphatase YigB (HAD superfamily)